MFEFRIGSRPEHSSAHLTPTATRSSQAALTQYLSSPESAELRASERRELAALSQERDSELFDSGLLAMAARAENRERVPLAARLYSWVQDHSENASLRDRALGRLAVFEGGGDFGDRLEFHSRHFFGQATDPIALGAMAAGGVAFRVARLSLLGRLLASPAANWATRGFGAQALAGSGAFLVESSAFTLAGRGLHALSGRPQEWTLRSLGHEWAAGAITLASLRGFGALGGGLYRRVHGSAASPWHTVYAQTAMFGGILAAHQVEERLGLRPRTSGTNALVDGVATLLQFNVAGRLLRDGMGRRWQAWEQGLDQRTERLRWNFPRPFTGTSGPTPALAFAGNAGLSSRPPTSRQTEGLLLMEGKPGGENGAPDAPPNNGSLSEIPPSGKLPSWLPPGVIGTEGIQTFMNALPVSAVVLEFVEGTPSEGLVGRIRMANTRVEKDFGYKPEETIDMALNRFTLPEDATLMARMQRMILTTGKINFHDVRFLRKDGAMIYCDVQGNAQQIGNRIIGFATLENVSKRRAAQAQILAEQARFRALLKGVPDVIFRISRDGTFLDAHAERPEIFVLPMDRVIGTKIRDLPVPPELHELGRTAVEGALSTGQTQYVEYHIPMPDGTIRIQEGRITASGPDEVVATIRDITEARQAETHRMAAARAETLKLIGRGLAHDANNVITPLSLLMNVLKSSMQRSTQSGRAPTAAEVQNWIESVESGAKLSNRLRDMIAGFRQLSEEPVGGPAFDLHSLLIPSELRNTLGADIALRVRLSADPWLVPGPKESIDRVILNLVVNAKDAMEGRPGSLRIETDRVVLSVDDLRQLASFSPGILNRRGGNFMRLRVQDNGPGISAANLSRIFEPYFSTKEKNNESGHGGLGLAMTQKLVQDAGGFLTVESSPNGTTFDIYLPQADRPSSPVLAASPALSQARSKPLLIVSSDQAFREALQASLASRGFERILTAETFAEAQSLAQSSGELGGLFTENRLPDDQQGIRLMEVLRQQNPQLAAIVWSGLDPQRYADRLGPSGTFLNRDTPLEQMGSVLEELLTRAEPQIRE